MIVGSIARRYARALFDLAVEQDHVEAWADALASLQEAVDSSQELRDVLENPIYTRDQRRSIVEKLVTALRLAREPASLVYLLADRGRLEHLRAIVETFARFADQKLGRVRARITSAVALDDGAAARIAERLSSAARAKVLVESDVDPALLGGVVARVGSITYDGSLRTQLEDLRRQLKQ
jgi:F-type H+-transporting ATPase subunit delta